MFPPVCQGDERSGSAGPEAGTIVEAVSAGACRADLSHIRRCLFAAMVWGGLATYAALDLNPQGVFCDYSRFDGRGLSAWLGFDCDLQWRNLGKFVLIAAGIGSVPMIAYLAFLAGRTVWRLFRGAASGES